MSESPFAPYETGPAFEGLKALMAGKHPPLALVGSGASANSGYPSWPELMKELREKVGGRAKIPQRRKALEGDFAWEAEVHLKSLGKTNFRAFIKERFGPPAALGEPHPTIARLPFRHFLTTNYDPCIELALQALGEDPGVVTWEDGKALSQFLIGLSGSTGPRTVVHLHGRHDRAKEAVLTESSYVERYIKSDDARRKLLAIFMTHPVVFIGFSMTDPDFSNLMREVTARLRTDPPCHYALLGYGSEPERDVYRERMRGKFGVEPVFFSYAKSETDKFANLLLLLQALSPRTGPRKTRPGPGPRKRMPPPPPGKEPTSAATSDPNDPEKNQWGGLAEIPGRRLSVVPRPGGLRSATQKFDLVVESLPGLPPLEGDVTFHLHPTFSEPVMVVAAKDGRAVLDDCEAYGAFTVGVSADQGRTRLELDLAMQPHLPDWFRRR
jgi:hypothetical protein